LINKTPSCLDPNLSQVWGNLNANGWVVLMNQNGFYFGPNSVINVGGLMVTTVPVAQESSAGGGFWQFNGTPPLAIKCSPAGRVGPHAIHIDARLAIAVCRQFRRR